MLGVVSGSEVKYDNPEKCAQSFRHKLVEIYNKRKQDFKLTDDYQRIENQIKRGCEEAAYDGRNCVYIMDLRLHDFINNVRYIRDDARHLEKMVISICEDLGLDINEGYITWKNSL